MWIITHHLKHIKIVHQSIYLIVSFNLTRNKKRKNSTEKTNETFYIRIFWDPFGNVINYRGRGACWFWMFYFISFYSHCKFKRPKFNFKKKLNLRFWQWYWDDRKNVLMIDRSWRRSISISSQPTTTKPRYQKRDNIICVALLMSTMSTMFENNKLFPILKTSWKCQRFLLPYTKISNYDETSRSNSDYTPAPAV